MRLADNGPEPLLSVKDLHVFFSARRKNFGPRVDLRAVNGISLDVQPGDVVGLVGESGSGKTTAARTILGLQQPESGAVLFNGLDMHALDGPELRSLRRKLQLVPQDALGSLNPLRSVRQTLAECLKVHKLVPETLQNGRIAELLEDVGLTAEFADRYPHTLSGGQVRRVCIARALATGPALIVADEPTAGLDVSVQAQILNLLKELCRRHNLSVLLISHDLNVVRHLCSKVAVMYFGRIVEVGDCAEVFADPKHPYTRALIQAAPTVNAIYPDTEPPSPIRGEVPSLANPPSGCSFHPRCDKAFEQCSATSPNLIRLDIQRSVACLLYEGDVRRDHAGIVDPGANQGEPSTL
jgi:oligopeptide/dipeptide ABC transporter ATP-binding protein